MARVALTGGMLLMALAAATGARAEPRSFPTPDAASAAVIAALEARDAEELLAIFGPENEDVIFSGDEVADRQDWGKFLGDYKIMHRITLDPADDGAATLQVGRQQWPFPVTIVPIEGGWRFDAEAAREEILARRIGGNELDVIDLLHGYVAAQARYRASDPDEDGLPSFASAILSDAGRRNGLYWPEEPGGMESPIGDFMARAAADGYHLDGVDVAPEPYLGYYFRVLTKQGPDAPGGALDYMANGEMVAGHALLAFPADYGESGISSFMVGEAGVVYEADLGPGTLEVAGGIDSFDPGQGWAPAEP